MGAYLSGMLVKVGAAVVVTSRNRTGVVDGVRYVTGDAQSSIFLDEILTMMHWDCIVDFMNYSTKSFELRYPKLLSRCDHYIFISSARVYAKSESPVNEGSARLLDVIKDEKYIETDEYALAKARQENFLFRSERKNWTIVRPYITYSPLRMQFGAMEKEGWLHGVLNGRSLVVPRDILHRKTTLTHGRDVASAIAKMIGVKRVMSEVYQITEPSSLYWREVLSVYLDTLVELGLERPAIKEVSNEVYSRLLPSPYPLIFDRSYNREFDCTKLQTSVALPSFMPAKDGLRECLQKFVVGTPHIFGRINWRAEGVKCRLCGDRIDIKSFASTKDFIKYLVFRSLPIY